MSYHRSYFEKNNTIIKNSRVNTAKNPNTDIFYGGGFSKFIFKIDLKELKQKIVDGEFVLNENTKHFLNLTNTIFGDENLKGRLNGRGRDRAISFDLIFFKINEFWDEGVGFSYEPDSVTLIGDKKIEIRPSNYYSRTTLDVWSENGIYTKNPDIITTIHFDNGDENIRCDITNYINSILIEETIDYGIGITFPPEYEDLRTEREQSVSFFTKYTQTFYEPFLETIFYDTIKDDRYSFSIGEERNLFLFVQKNGKFFDLDELPVVDILNANNEKIPSLENLITQKVKRGVYKVTFTLFGILCDGKKFFYDKWKNLYANHINLLDIKQKFIPQKLDEGYKIGEYRLMNDKLNIQFNGISLNERIKRGEKRNVIVNFKSFNEKKNIPLNEAFYRIFIKEGRTQVNVFDWTTMDKTTNNFFVIDTSFLIPREYFIELKFEYLEQIYIYENEIKFEIVSEK